MRRRILLALPLLAACGGPTEETPPTSPPPTTTTVTSVHQRPCPEGSELSWENFGAPFLQNWCTGCHSSDLAGPARYGAPEGMDFDTPARARAHRERIWARAADQNTTMPPAAGPGEEERQLLGEWLGCGAP